MRDMRNYLRRGIEDALTAAGFDIQTDAVRHAVTNAVSPIAMEFGMRDRLITRLFAELAEWRKAYGGVPAGRESAVAVLEAQARIVLEDGPEDEKEA